MALDFPVVLELTRRQKLEQTLVMALDVYLSHVGCTPYENAMRVQKDIDSKMGREYPDTEAGRSDALRDCVGDLGKFMRETALYMGVLGAVRFIITDVIYHEWAGVGGEWLPVKSGELRALNYQLSYRVVDTMVEYKLYYVSNGVGIDTGVVKHPLLK